MYLYIENKHFILIEDVYLIIDYADFFKKKENKAILEKYKIYRFRIKTSDELY